MDRHSYKPMFDDLVFGFQPGHFTGWTLAGRCIRKMISEADPAKASANGCYNRKGKIMNSFHGLVLRVAALVAGSAIVGACIASNPATAQDFNSMLKALS